MCKEIKEEIDRCKWLLDVCRKEQSKRERQEQYKHSGQDTDGTLSKYRVELQVSVKKCRELHIDIDNILKYKNAVVEGNVSCVKGKYFSSFRGEEEWNELAILNVRCGMCSANYEGVIFLLELVLTALTIRRNLIIFCNKEWRIIFNFYLNMDEEYKNFDSCKQKEIRNIIKFLLREIRKKGDIFFVQSVSGRTAMEIAGAASLIMDFYKFRGPQTRVPNLIGTAVKAQISENKVAIYYGGGSDRRIAGYLSSMQSQLNILDTSETSEIVRMVIKKTYEIDDTGKERRLLMDLFKINYADN